MDLSSLKPAAGSNKREGKRVGRGQGSGKGGTATRGHKGAQSRSGYSRKVGFEGGQMPLQRTSPKFGFKNRNRVEYRGVNLSKIQKLAEDNKLENIDFETLVDFGVVKRTELVKILGNGDITLKVNVKAHAFSKTAAEKIEAQGGTVEKY
ncbi:MAG: 50S ribosomal protein L15 [Bacteroidia bacterium]|nr:MAG: 50S ribosomal protein L15 [Bacteroidia bacterium]